MEQLFNILAGAAVWLVGLFIFGKCYDENRDIFGGRRDNGEGVA